MFHARPALRHIAMSSMQFEAQLQEITRRRLAKQRVSAARAAASTRPRFITTELPRPPPKPLPVAETYSTVARPGVYYERPRFKRELPEVSVSADTLFIRSTSF